MGQSLGAVGVTDIISHAIEENYADQLQFWLHSLKRFFHKWRPFVIVISVVLQVQQTISTIAVPANDT
jgi:hypothetical protein